MSIIPSNDDVARYFVEPNLGALWQYRGYHLDGALSTPGAYDLFTHNIREARARHIVENPNMR